MLPHSTLCLHRNQILRFLPLLYFISLVILVFSVFTTKVYSAQATLTWESNSESDLAGYSLHYGNISGNYEFSIDVGNRTSYTLTGLTGDETYSFAVKAYDFYGLESAYSEELSEIVSKWINSFSDDFSTDTTGDYDVIDTLTEGGTGQFLYDEVDTRVQVITGKDISMQFGHELTPLDTGIFKIDFQPITTIKDHTYTATQAASEYSPGTIPDIKANNSDGPIKIDKELLIKISLSAAEHIGQDADWWLVASTPTGELEHYDLSQGGFTSGLLVTLQGALFDFDSYAVSIDTSGLVTGTYTYYFGVDLNMNGKLDGSLYYDSVKVDVVNGGDGDMSILLQQDINNYYYIGNTDGLEYGYVAKVVDGHTVEFEIFRNGYLQGNNYQIKITFRPDETTVDAFGEIITINTDYSSIVVNSVYVSTSQQDAYYDNIEYFRYNGDTLEENQPPITIYDSATTTENTPVTIDVLTNDTDVDGTIGPATITIVPSTVVINGDGTVGTSDTAYGYGAVVANADGTITFTPNDDIVAGHPSKSTITETFKYTVQDTDGATSSEAVVVVTVQ